VSPLNKKIPLGISGIDTSSFKFFFEIYLPVREHKLFVGSGGSKWNIQVDKKLDFSVQMFCFLKGIFHLE